VGAHRRRRVRLVVLPRWLARFNRVATNRVSRPVARRLPGFGVVVHTGRRSGQEYCTPVNVFRRDGGFVVALTYGSGAQWVRNVLAAERAEIVVRGQARSVAHPHVVTDSAQSLVPQPARSILRTIGVQEFLIVDDV
jgi:deazaflavin-dependent oxidoreductase (nitroreductase family)